MNKIIAVRTRKYRIEVRLEGALGFSLARQVAQDANLEPGRELSDEELARLQEADLFHRSLERAVRYLGYRPRSQAEIELRLRRYGAPAELISRVMARLREQGLINDVAFARFWQESRELNPRSRRLLGFELRQKGVDPEIISEATAGLDDEESAYRAGQRKVRVLSRLDYSSFHRKLGDFLLRRGFSYQVCRHAVDRLWQETSSLR